MIWAGLALLILVGLVLWPRTRARPVGAARAIVLDGSNVMFWADGTPKLSAVAAVVSDVQRRGFRPIVYFDANVGYKLEGRHADGEELARRLDLAAEQVRVVPSGEPADGILLEAAVEMGARVISNDRFQEWRGTYPALRSRRFLVQGYVRGKKVELTL